MDTFWPEWIIGKKIAIFGTGISGRKAIELLQKAPCELFAFGRGEVPTWYKELSSLIPANHCFSEEDPDSPQLISDCDLIIISPGIARNHPLLTLANTKKVPLLTELELAFPFAHVPIVAVTGTNGKTTTVTLMEQILKNSGYTPFMGGNIGIPFCQYAIDQIAGKKYDVIVLEVSSFQLESIEKFCPDVAVFLNLSLTHLERYRNLQEYAEAKFRITRNMRADQALIYPRNNPIIDKWAQKQRLILLPFEISRIKEELESQFQLTHFQLTGQHNLENLFCAYKSLNFLGMNLKGVQKTINNFTGVPYRLQRLSTNDSFEIYNDAKSTNSDATLKAITAIKAENKKLYLIYGGQKRDKSLPLSVPKELYDQVQKIFLIGETTDELSQLLKGHVTSIKSYTFEEAIRSIRQELFQGAVLFSPGFPSFDQFKDYKERGKKFEEFLLNTRQI